MCQFPIQCMFPPLQLDTMLVISLFVVSLLSLVMADPDSFVRAVLSMGAILLLRPLALPPILRYIVILVYSNPEISEFECFLRFYISVSYASLRMHINFLLFSYVTVFTNFDFFIKYM